jgi:hypothetical protein
MTDLKPKRFVVAIDPGIHKLGLAFGLEGEIPTALTFDPTKGRKASVKGLVGSALSRAVAEAAWRGPLADAFAIGRDPRNVVLVHEVMQEDSRTAGKAENLFALTLTMGALVATAPEGCVTWGIPPREWKGNFPKPVIHARLERKYEGLDGLGHDALDALGIWDWGVQRLDLLGRLGRLDELLKANRWVP